MWEDSIEKVTDLLEVVRASLGIVGLVPSSRRMSHTHQCSGPVFNGFLFSVWEVQCGAQGMLRVYNSYWMLRISGTT